MDFLVVRITGNSASKVLDEDFEPDLQHMSDIIATLANGSINHGPLTNC